MSEPLQLPYVAFFGRTLNEYLLMFCFDMQYLKKKKILDCASGPASFVAEGHRQGLDIVGCDPMFTKEPSQLLKDGMKNLESCFQIIEQHPNSLHYNDYDSFKKSKFDAFFQFEEDYKRNSKKGRYIAASLPALPFKDMEFDLVLGGNFLFAYAHHSAGGLYAGKEFDLDFHLSAVTEMARVTKSELRLSPMGSFSPPARPHDYRDAVIKCLQELGFTCTLQKSYFDSGLKGFNDVLIAKRKS